MAVRGLKKNQRYVYFVLAKQIYVPYIYLINNALRRNDGDDK